MITKIGAAALQQKDNADERPGLGHLATGLGGLGLLDAVLTREGSMETDPGFAGLWHFVAKVDDLVHAGGSCWLWLIFYACRRKIGKPPGENLRRRCQVH